MILKELMMGNIQVLPFPLADSKVQSEKIPGSKSFFGEILDKTVKSRPVEDGIQDSDKKPQVKCFREIESRNKTLEASLNSKRILTGECVESKQAENKDEKVQVNIDNSEAILNCFTQVLGLNMDELKSLMISADITIEEFTGRTEVNELAAKLSQTLGLSGEQQKSLAEILDLIGTQISASTNMYDTGNDLLKMKVLQNTNLPDTVQEEGNTTPEIKSFDTAGIVSTTDSANTGNTSDKTGLKAIIGKLKFTLQELGEKLKADKGALIKKISIEIAPVMEKIVEIKTVHGNTVTSENIQDTVPVIEIKLENENTDKKNDGSMMDAKGESQKAESIVKPAAEAVVGVVAQDEQTQSVAVVNQIQRNEPVVDVQLVDLKSPIQTREVINQVIEKAKVVLTGDKSEMVMDLKPDSLGKISLKVVTENGIVMAKFVAESQQVKQILEGNMQILKDSLEKQGLNVQGFSVSVRQDSNNGYNRQNDLYGEKQINSAKPVMNNGNLYSVAENTERLQLSNPYYWSNNTINLIA